MRGERFQESSTIKGGSVSWKVLCARPWAIARPSLPVISQNARLRSVTVFGRSLISPDDRVMYEGVRVFRGRFFARGPDPSPTLKVLAILEVEARKTLRKVLDIP